MGPRRHLLYIASTCLAVVCVAAVPDTNVTIADPNWEILTRLIETSDQVLDNVCGGKSAISTFSVASALRNLTNADVLNILREQYRQYDWATPGDLDVAYLCGLMQDFAEERDTAQANGKPLELVFYGDSTIQCMRYKSDECLGAIDVYNGWWGEQYRAAVWGIGGETTNALMWRLLAGNLPEPTSKVIVLYTGVMDVQKADQDPEVWTDEMNRIASQIIQIAAFLKNSTHDAQVLLMGLLPITGYDGTKGLPTVVMGTEVQAGIKSINSQLSAFGAAEPRVSYIECMQDFLTKPGGNTINETYYSTNNVPTGEGFKKFAGCINRFVDQYMAQK